MKKVLSLIVFLLFLLLIWFSWNWYKDVVLCCPVDNIIVKERYGPLIFDCVTGEVITNDLWPEKKKEILSSQRKGQSLLLVGPYFENETENNGISRAEKVKMLFTEIPADEIFTSARPVSDCEASKGKMLHELKYKWVIRNDDIIEYLDRTILFYKYDSDEEITNENVFKFFNQLSEFLKTTGDKIVLTGHTSDEGEEDYNQALGMKRAEEFKRHLMSMGVSADQIMTASEGESKPIASNETEEGKAKNRRVEIQIIN